MEKRIIVVLATIFIPYVELRLVQKNIKTVCFDHQSSKVSVTSFSLRKDEVHYESLYWNFPELREIEKEYNKLESDFKIVYIHWGVEFINYPAIE